VQADGVWGCGPRGPPGSDKPASCVGFRTINHRVSNLVAKGWCTGCGSPTASSGRFTSGLALGSIRPLELVPLADIIEAALRDLGPTELTPLAMAILEHGHKTKSSVSVFRSTICRLLRADRKRFSKVSGKWRIT